MCFSQSPDLAAALLATAEKCTGPLPVEKSGRVDVEGVHEGRRQVEARIGRALDHVEGGTARPYNCEQERRRGCRGYAPSPGETIRAGRRASRGERIGRYTGPLPGLQAQRVLHRGHRRSDPTHDQGGKVRRPDQGAQRGDGGGQQASIRRQHGRDGLTRRRGRGERRGRYAGWSEQEGQGGRGRRERGWRPGQEGEDGWRRRAGEGTEGPGRDPDGTQGRGRPTS